MQLIPLAMASFLLLSSMKLYEVSNAVTDQQLIAVATAVAFFLVCFILHSSSDASPRARRRRLAALMVIYGIQVVVAGLLSVMGTVPSGSSLATALISLCTNPTPESVFPPLLTFAFVLLFDVLVLLLDIVRESGGQRLPGGVL